MQRRGCSAIEADQSADAVRADVPAGPCWNDHRLTTEGIIWR
jgi:hypothetical protein